MRAGPDQLRPPLWERSARKVIRPPGIRLPKRDWTVENRQMSRRRPVTITSGAATAASRLAS
jgi:hypothetical protein